MRPEAPAREAVLMKRATSLAVTTAGALVIAKLAGWLLTGSVSLLSSLVDSVMDVFASAVNFGAVRHALAPADREHRFGHGKAEPLAALAQAAFIGGSGVFLLIESVGRIVHPQPVRHGLVGIGVMVLSIIATVVLVAYQRFVVRQTQSTAIQADSIHYAADTLVNGSVILSLFLIETRGWLRIDGIIAMGIAAFILYSAVRIVREALVQLMDHELPEETRQRIVAIVRGHPQVTDCHDLRTRTAGLQAFVQLHIEVDGDLPLKRAHEISDQVEALILEAFPNTEVIIHADPEGIAEEMPSFART